MEVKPIGQSLSEYARAMAGGLLFSLPLLYTMELWHAGATLGPGPLLEYMGATFLLLLGYNRYAGLRPSYTAAEVAIESVEEMGLGLLITALVLWFTGRIGRAGGWEQSVRVVVVCSMIVAIGVSVGKAQLSASDHRDQGHREQQKPPRFVGQFVLALCGAVLVASNVAPTREIVVIGTETQPGQLLLIMLLSLGVGAGVLYYSDFSGGRRWVREPDGLLDVAAGVTIMYTEALLASAVMLWFFGRLAGLPLYRAAALIVVLGLPASLGASAGRLLLQV